MFGIFFIETQNELELPAHHNSSVPTVTEDGTEPTGLTDSAVNINSNLLILGTQLLLLFYGCHSQFENKRNFLA